MTHAASEVAFVWVTHQPSVARWAKREIAERAPHLHFAFARPGLMTFKVVDGAGLPIPSSFARASGWSLGRATDLDAFVALVKPWREAHPRRKGPLRLHVFERDVDVPWEERDPETRGARARAVEASLREALPNDFDPEVRALRGDVVLDVIVPHGGEPDEPWFVGWHVHDLDHGPWPGGTPGLAAPPEAPSRAWSKIEEALRWADFEPKPGEIAVELGSAPGGASLAMLERGLTVYGVDPGAMDPRVLAYEGSSGQRFVHLHAPAAEVEKLALPRRYQWLLSDVNLAPMIALKYIERFVALAHGGLRGAVLTLKLNDDGVVAALPRLRERIAKLGAKSVRYTQLPSHRSEIVALLKW
jgi:23S rRNA (cytidine2498-2'-O)-methyltransferase